MKRALAAGGAAVAALAMLTQSLDPGPVRGSSSAPQHRALAALSDLAAPSAARAECKESEHTCVQHELSSDCNGTGSGNHYRTRTRKIHADCSQAESFSSWSCVRPYGDECYG